MKLKPYPKYKNSGIQWIGEIPEGWEVRKIKHLCFKGAEYGLNEPSDNYVDIRRNMRDVFSQVIWLDL
jgi:type I restriction enzyme S subunit